MHDLVQPNAWVAIKLSSENVKVVQIIPNTTISLGKYGSFPSNLIIERPYHLTYEVQDKKDGETFSRLRVVPASEIHADVLAEEDGQKPVPEEQDDEEDAEANNGVRIQGESAAAAADPSNVIAVQDGTDYTLVDKHSGNVLARSGQDEVEAQARQMLTMEEIEELKKQDTGGGKNIIAKLMLSHRALGEKTSFSLAKYKILKNKKYLRRFSVMPLHPSTLGQYILDEKEASKVLEMRQEALALLGCWANVHFGGEDGEGGTTTTTLVPNDGNPVMDSSQLGGRWLVVDDTGGLVVAAMAERMGILHPDLTKQIDKKRPGQKQHEGNQPEDAHQPQNSRVDGSGSASENTANTTATTPIPTAADASSTNDTTADSAQSQLNPPRTFRNDFEVDLATTNTITLLHSANQPHVSLLRYWNCDLLAPNLGTADHPLLSRLFPVSWLQLLEPSSDTTYASAPPEATDAELQSWKSNRRGNYHRKRRRWARTRFMVDQAHAGGFSGLVIATTMDLASVLRNALPLLAGGAPIAVYSPTVEPLVELADCFSVSRRAAWTANPPPAAEGASAESLERWPGSGDFPVNPTLLLGAGVQTSRAKKWQVLPGRTHPLMMAKGGAEGYVFTGWKAVPAEGKVEARGKFKRSKKTEGA